MQTKIAFFDIDGTLIDMQSKRITEKTLEALQRLRAGGVKICLATGRSPVALPVFPGVEFDAYLTFNGSLCYTAGGETIFSNPIAHEDVQKIIANGAAIGRPVCVSVRDRLAAFDGGSPRELAQALIDDSGAQVGAADDRTALVLKLARRNG